jgi:hypothetical protein
MAEVAVELMMNKLLLTAGYFAHAAKMLSDGTFKSVTGSVVLHAHPTSLMFVSGSMLAVRD